MPDIPNGRAPGNKVFCDREYNVLTINNITEERIKKCIRGRAKESKKVDVSSTVLKVN